MLLKMSFPIAKWVARGDYRSSGPHKFCFVLIVQSQSVTDYDPSEEILSMFISILSPCPILPHADADTASTERSY